jgi:hypothetical protein
MLPIGMPGKLPAAATRAIVGVIPAIPAVLAAMIICLIALFLPTRHQQYALKVQKGITDLARVLVGAPTVAPTRTRPTTPTRSSSSG